jgi:hypothetical protein
MYINVNAERAAEDYSYLLYYVHILYGAAAADCVEVCIHWRRRRAALPRCKGGRAVYCCRAEFTRESCLHFVSQRIASERKIPRAKSENLVHFSSHHFCNCSAGTNCLLESLMPSQGYIMLHENIGSGGVERNHQFVVKFW